MNKIINKAITIKLQDNQIRGYATVEAIDTQGDIIRVSGCDINSYNKPESPMKILISHQKMLQDGSPSVIGKVVELQKTTTPDGIPAIEFIAEFATTELAQEWYQLYKDGFLDSFSVGCEVVTVEAIKDPQGYVTGYDYKQTILTEISAVAIPANPLATVTRTLELISKSKQLEESNNVNIEKIVKIDKLEKTIDKNITDFSQIKGELEIIKKELNRFNLFEERLDEILSKISKKDLQLNADTRVEEPTSVKDISKKLSEVVERVNKIVK